MTHIDQNQAFTDSFYDITEMEFQFDEKNRMTQYRFGGAGSWYQVKYDALGRVRERVDLTPTTTKYYSDGRQLVQQLDSSNNVEFDYFRGPTGLMRQWEENGTPKKRFYIKDNLDTVWALVDPSNLNVTRYNYNAWGEHLDKDETAFPTDANWMRYICSRAEAFGEPTAQKNVCYHLGYRHYLPALCNFLQRDPLSLGKRIIGGPYNYGDNNPIVNSDPNGLAPVSCGPGGCPSPPVARFGVLIQATHGGLRISARQTRAGRRLKVKGIAADSTQR
jgi:RHS repeat-associated protein